MIKINYYCKYCNFGGDLLSQIKQHLSTKKHKRLSDNDICIANYNKTAYKCENCEKIYNDKSNLHRHIKATHKKICADMNTSNNSNVDSTYEMIEMAMNTDDKEVKTNMMKLIKMVLDEKNKLIETTTKMKDKELELTSKIKDKELELTSKIKDIYENENEYHKTIANNAGQIVNKTMNMLTYAVQNFKETPKLETLDSTTARKLLKHEVNGGKNIKVNDDQVAEYIAKISEAKILPKHLGNTLVSHYKKDDPNRQSIWTTDVNRIKFIAKTTDGWIKDNNCDMINKAIITPLLKEVTKVMDEYCNDRMENINKMSGREEAKYVEVSEQRVNIKSDMISEKLNKAILKHISPCFLMQKHLK
jgi:hypothetical protein